MGENTAFVYYIFDQVTRRLHVKNQLPKTGGVMNMWKGSDPSLKIDIKDAKANPSLIRPGQIFIMSRPGKGLGHTGIVIGVDVNKREFITIEGNTNDQQSGEGDRVGVNRRKLDKLPLLGFIDFFRNNRTPEFEKDIMSMIDGNKPPLSPLDTIPTDAVVSGYEEGPTQIKSKPAGFMAKLLANLSNTVSGKLADADEIQAQMDKLR
ncbi:MAG: CHAP domain-containing protein [Actinobacteria bacterium]|nr:CHAP domain-containing protein [Actinomycetota bacterium]